MSKHLDDMALKQERIKNMKKWTFDDYLFYQSFFDEIYGEEESSTEKDEAYIEEAYQRFITRVKKERQGS